MDIQVFKNILHLFHFSSVVGPQKQLLHSHFSTILPACSMIRSSPSSLIFLIISSFSSVKPLFSMATSTLRRYRLLRAGIRAVSLYLRLKPCASSFNSSLRSTVNDSSPSSFPEIVFLAAFSFHGQTCWQISQPKT